MKFFSTLAVLTQLALFGSLVQATVPMGDILQYSTRELVQELEARMIIAKRTAPDSSFPSRLSRRSILYDELNKLTSRATPGTTSAVPAPAAGLTGAADDPSMAGDTGSSDPSTGSTSDGTGSTGSMSSTGGMGGAAGGASGMGGAGGMSSTAAGAGQDSTLGSGTQQATGGGHGHGHGHGHGGHGSHSGKGGKLINMAKSALSSVSKLAKQITKLHH